MATLMETFEQQYAALTADITSKSSRIPNLAQDEKAAMVTEVERHLEEANELLEQMELEVRTLSVAARPKYQNRVKSYQAELARLRKEFRARIAFCDELKSREELLSNDDNCVGDDQRQRLLDNTERMERSTKLLKGGYKLALETEKVGAAILSDLSAQRETITRAREKVKETDYDIGKSSHVLSGMMRRAMQNRAILYLVAALVLVTVVFGIYYTVRKHM
ncbi:vesicle transport through interaction with t-SNAREs homolog 1A isoform X2 [Rhipicephalus sanguineus]|uniref:vesicle transport through interaction with t-SNAREs homolog 1A isoform X2 n=1 Tax=Rhipicephalus sanguineus TaxID=34632 RepID=UPI0018962728|nr:vesicle transport through interaction with t-SNAREs homolog 1A isoform X2 [Rhipicephalus sanguineus]